MVKKAKKTAKKKAARKTTKKATRAGTKKKTTRGKKNKGAAFIISKSRTKATSGLNVAGDFYGALDEAVRAMICSAETRASANGRKTLRPQDL